MEQLQNLVQTLEDQNKVKRDFVTNGRNLHFEDGKLVVLKNDIPIIYTPTAHFHTQVGEKLGIPRTYYQKCLEKAVDLLDSNVNHWIDEQGKNMLIRSFENPSTDNVARAFLSDRYNMIDNMDVLLETLEALKETGLPVEVKNAELSETKMYLNITCPEIEVQATEMLKLYRRTVGVGSGIISGFTLKNSEIGAGQFEIAPRAVVLCCDNGMVLQKDSLKRVHLGSKMDELDFHKNSDVLNANRKLIKEQVKHAVAQFLSKNYLERLVKKFTEAGDQEITAPIQGVIEVIANKYDITEERKANILNHFIRGGDIRRIGVVNALTEECQTIMDIDEKYKTESISFEVLENFKAIETAAVKLIAKQSGN